MNGAGQIFNIALPSVESSRECCHLWLHTSSTQTTQVGLCDKYLFLFLQRAPLGWNLPK